MKTDNRWLPTFVAVSLAAHAALLVSVGAPTASGSGAGAIGMEIVIGAATGTEKTPDKKPAPAGTAKPDPKAPEPIPSEDKKPEPKQPDPKPVEVTKPEPKQPDPKPVEIKKPEPKHPDPKPVEIKKPEPKKPDPKPVEAKKPVPPAPTLTAEAKPKPKPRPKPVAKKHAAPKPRAKAKPPAKDTTRAQAPKRRTRQQAALKSGDDGNGDNGAGRGDGVVPIMRAPRFGQAPRPASYPRLSVQREEEGTVIVRALVHRRGTPASVRIWRSSGYPRLDHAALEAVRAWVFLPMQRGGRAVTAWVEIPVRFRLH